MKKNIVTILILCLFGAYAVPEQKGRFVFTQVKYDGQWDPYPETWRDILEFITTTTSIIPMKERRVITLDDDKLFVSPFIVMLGNEKFPVLSKKQRENLRKYLSNGGIVLIENSSAMKGSAFDSGFRREIAEVFPEKKLKKLEIDHPVHRSYYLLRKIGGRRLASSYLEGIEIAGRAALIYSQNDLIGAWAKDRFGNYLWECVPGGQTQRFEAQKLTINIIMYSVTGTYKSDAVHQPYINRKLRK